MTELKQFDFDGQDVRVALLDGEPWWAHNDVCACLGIADAPQAAARLEEDEKGWADLPTPGGAQRTRVVNEPGLYSLILRSKTPEAKRFKRWVTHEVLPSIRKTGSFQISEAGATARTLADDHEAALVLALEETRRRKAAEAKVAELEPPARAWSALADTKRDYSVGDSAKILSRDPAISIGRQRLFGKLVDFGMVYTEIERGRATYKPMQEHVDADRLRLRMGGRWQHPKTGEWEAGAPQLRITAKGLAYLHKKLGGTGALDLEGGGSAASDAGSALVQ